MNDPKHNCSYHFQRKIVSNINKTTYLTAELKLWIAKSKFILLTRRRLAAPHQIAAYPIGEELLEIAQRQKQLHRRACVTTSSPQSSSYNFSLKDPKLTAATKAFLSLNLEGVDLHGVVLVTESFPLLQLLQGTVDYPWYDSSSHSSLSRKIRLQQAIDSYYCYHHHGSTQKINLQLFPGFHYHENEKAIRNCQPLLQHLLKLCWLYGGAW